jgi:L-serine deaminase
MQGTATLTATPSTVSGTATITSTTVNTNTSYLFSLTTIDPLSSSGRIKIIFPNTVTILTSSSSCASVVGTGMAIAPVCSFNTG